MDKLEKVLEDLGLTTVDAGDVSRAISQYNRFSGVDCMLGKSIMRQIKKDDESWDLEIIDTIEVINKRYKEEGGYC